MGKIKDELDTFFKEKQLPSKSFTVVDKYGTKNYGDTEYVISAILNCGEKEQKKIQDTLTKLDFKNADINGYLEHLFKGLVNN